MLGADRETNDVPVADHALPRAGFGESAEVTDALDQPGELGRGRDIPGQNAARAQRRRGGRQDQPGREQVQYEPVDDFGGRVVGDVAGP